MNNSAKYDFSKIPSKPISDKTIVLDLDNTLICTYDKREHYNKLQTVTNPRNVQIKDRIYTFEYPEGNEVTKVWGVKRPYLRDFIYFCFCYFKNIYVWSAGKREYVNKIVKEIFMEFRSPDVILAQEDCQPGDDKNPFYKPLSKLCRQYNLDISKTYILDDNRGTFVFNEMNAINIPNYSPNPCLKYIKEKDPSLLQVINWLMLPHVINADDVRLLEKNIIFNTSIKEYDEIKK